MTGNLTLADRLEALFRTHAGEWLDGRLLARTAGYAGWRTRVSDLRKRGLSIENRVRTVRTTNGDSVFRVTEYCYRPASLLDVAEAPTSEATAC